MLIVVAAIVAPFIGCATAPPTTPVEVVQAWSTARHAGDRAAAARLERPGAGGLEGVAPAAGPPVEASRRAIWRTDGRDLVVAGVGGDLRLSGGVLGLSRATTPEEALSLLGRALRTGDHALVLELLPATERARWDATRLGARLAASPAWADLGRALEAGPLTVDQESDDRAAATIGGTTIVVAREDEGWKVVDLTPREPYAPAPEDGPDASEPE